MRKCLLPIAATVLALGVGPFPFPAAHAADIVIGAGDRLGVFYQVGRAVCRVATRNVQGLTCEAFPTAGKDTTESHANMNNLLTGAIELGVSSSDWQYHVLNKTGPARFIEEDFSTIRSLFSLQAEPFTVVAREGAGIGGLADLVGKRVNIGAPGSRERRAMSRVMKAMGWTQKSFTLADELPVAQQSLAFCHNQVQAMVYITDHPNAAIEQVSKLCGGKVVGATGPAIDGLIRERPYLSPAIIPGGLYPNNPTDVTAFGTRITLVSSADVSDEIVYTVVKAVFENLDFFRRMHPAFRGLEPGRMIKDGLIAPLHEGAKRYYLEKALM